MRRARLDLKKGKAHLITRKDLNNLNIEIDFDPSVFYLSEVLTRLPSGIIHKGKTGIGATTLETNARRNSIIVEPLKIIASSKAQDNHLYVGSSTDKHPRKTIDKDILEYLSNPKIKYKKIFCVIDSLKRVLRLIPKEKRGEYFLMLDESDSLQLDSSFRKTMLDSYKCFKNHPVDQKCLISATNIRFNDPDFKDIPYFSFNFQEQGRKINLVHTETLFGTLIDKVKELYKSDPLNKLVVAYNNVTKLAELAKNLTYQGIDKKAISILSSSSSKSTAGDFYKELNGEKWPTQINLITSAYYSGFDILEKYHLILPTNPSDFLNILPERKITQIAGRARNGLLTETILLKYESIDNSQNLSLADLQGMANSQIQTFSCIKNNFENFPFLNERIQKSYQALLVASSFQGFELVDRTSQNPKINYLSIDAILEIQDERKRYYSSKDKLEEMLVSSGHQVFKSTHNSSSFNDTQNNPVNAELSVLKLKELLNNQIDLIPENHNDKIIKRGIEIFNSYSSFFFKEELINAILKVATTTRATNNFIKKAEFQIQDDSNPEKELFKTLFPKGKTLPISEATSILNKYFSLISTPRNLTPSQAFSELKYRATVKRINNEKYKGANAKITIVNYNPTGLKHNRIKSENPGLE